MTRPPAHLPVRRTRRPRGRLFCACAGA